MRKFLACFLVTMLIATLAFGQEQEVHRKSGPRRQLATIIFAGIGGAILGLSTLSFYGRPQDQLPNIAIGFAVGVIAGTVYVTYKSATTHDYYYEPDKKASLLLPHSIDLENDLLADADPVPTAINMLWAPLIQKTLAPGQSTTSFGGQIIFSF